MSWVRGEEIDRTPLAWLGERAAANTSEAILAELKKLDFLRELGVTEWDRSTINPNRLKFLAQLGRKATSQALQPYGGCTSLSDRSRLSAPLHEGNYRRTRGALRSLPCPILFPCGPRTG